MQNYSELIATEEQDLSALKDLLYKIDKGIKIENDKVFKVYADQPKTYQINEKQIKQEADIFAEQACIFKKILEHKNCPENLKFAIISSDNPAVPANYRLQNN